ncbi:hypothetical protein ACFO3U_09745 [Flavobacterium ponti]|uniref:Lipoprotein n=1 Tax=Flavobacterium ponti TaxID=665133 RepID=A0ABV9P3V0_9FLAO
MKYVINTFIILLLISCSKNEVTEKDYLEFTKKLISKVKENKNQNYDNLFNVTDVIKEIDKISDSLGYTNKVDRKIFNSKFNYEKKCAEYFKNLSKNLNGKIEITNHFKSKDKFHFIICTELKNNVEVTEIVLINKNEIIKIDNFYSYTTSLDMRSNYINYAIFKTNEPSFNFANNKLEKCIKLYKEGYNIEAYEVYKEIPIEFSRFPNFLFIKYKVFINLMNELNPEEIESNYAELIGFNYKNKGFRYSKTNEYYKIFGQDSIANKYKDSLSFLIKDIYFINKIK